MAIYTNTLPQSIKDIHSVSMAELITILPEKLPYKKNFWIAGKIVRFGVTSDNLVFLIESDEEPSNELRSYFCDLVRGLGIVATVNNQWKNEKFAAVMLYNQGELIWDKVSLNYKHLPNRNHDIPIITVENLRDKLPSDISWTCTLYLTGGIVKNGWSANDADIIVFDNVEKKVLREIGSYFTEILGWKTDVGRAVMVEREPVYLYKLYEKGKLCL